MKLRTRFVAFWLVFLPALSTYALTNGLALKPPMGWNTWYAYYMDPRETNIMLMADVMATNGMRDAGYDYICLDDGWQGYRDTQGLIVAHTNKFPSGMRSLADYLHAKGFKFGIYSSRGTMTCGGLPGSQGYVTNDANTYANWGVDLLKHDNCYAVWGDHQANYEEMKNALAGCGRPIVYSICAQRFDLWMPETGNLFRTGADIGDTWPIIKKHIDQNNAWAAYAGPGRWCDNEFMRFEGGMTLTQYKTYFTVNCMMAAPLFISRNLLAMPQNILSLVINAEAIAVNQDAAGYIGRRILRRASAGGSLDVWVKRLGMNGMTNAVALVNLSTNSAIIPVCFRDVLLQDTKVQVRDLWTHTDLGTFDYQYAAEVEPDGVKLLQLVGTPGGRALPTVPQYGTNYLSDLYWTFCTNGYGPVELDYSVNNVHGADGGTITLNGITFTKGLGAHANSRIDYALEGHASRFQADVGVDDGAGTTGSVQFHVYADGVKLFDSGIMRTDSVTQTVDVSVSGKTNLILIVTDAGDSTAADQADWAGARLVAAPNVGPTLSGPQCVNGEFRCFVHGAVNANYVVQVSTNLADWAALQTNAAPFLFTDPGAAGQPRRFYRALFH